ncbi:MAG: RNA 2',3'-cyclic phosphodiesterase [Pseudomonadota bacterium]|nr:RNA 2',3'-cyclic phosphodiesterase [Pseudomonadota bacterium]
MNTEAVKSRLPRSAAPTQRLFFALWPSEEARAGLAEVMASLHVRQAKPVPADNLHITLLFLGSVTAQTRICAEKVGEGIAGHPFELRLDQIGYWPKSGILWLGAREAPESLAALVRSLHLGIAGCGIDLDARPFKPHVTLMRKALVVRRERPLVAVAWRVDDFALVESKTTPDGSHYQVLTSWRLGADSCGAQASLREPLQKSTI